MAAKHEDELIKIKKREKKEKPEKKKKKKQPRERKTTVKNAPKTNGVRLDFSSEETPRYTKYYLKISRRYRLARYLCIISLVVFLLVTVIFYRENITYANLMYLVRDLDSGGDVSVGVYNDISYEKSAARDFDLFRRRIAVASTTGFKLYTQAGTADLESEDIIALPRLEVSDKYALVYDAGGNGYSVYTTVAKVLSAKSEFSIDDAAVSDSGRYALLTGSDEAKALITVYSEDFKSITEYYKDKYVMDISIDSEGEYICAVLCEVRSSEVECEVMIGKIGTKDSVTHTYTGMMPVSCEYTEDGRLFVLCDSALLVFDGDKEYARVDFGGLTPGCFDVEKNTIAVSFPQNIIGNENALKVFDTEGKELYNIKINEKLTTVATDGEEAAYAVGETAVTRLSLEDGKTETCEVTDRAVGAVCVPGSLIVCSSEGTKSYFVEG